MQPGHPVIVTEMYLPQQYARESTFVDALENSLNKSKVTEHFDTKRRMAKIKRCLPKKLRTTSKYKKLKESIITNGRTFGGYSVYDVLGTFVWKKGVVYDANSCVRIIDPIEVPKYSDLKKTYLAWAKLSPEDRDRLFQGVIRTLCALRQHHGDYPNLNSILHPKLMNANRGSVQQANPTGLRLKISKKIQDIADNRAIQEIVRYFDDWVDQGSFLLYGFLGYHLHKAGTKEKAIWLTSHFAVLNVYKRKYQRKR